jgi:hypothetical protein
MKINQMVRVTYINEETNEEIVEYIEMELEKMPSFAMFLLHEVHVQLNGFVCETDIENLVYERCLITPEMGEGFYNNLCDKYGDLAVQFENEKEGVCPECGTACECSAVISEALADGDSVIINGHNIAHRKEDTLDDCEYMQEDVSFEDTLEELVEKRPYDAIERMVIKWFPCVSESGDAVALVTRENKELFLKTLDKVNVLHYPPSTLGNCVEIGVCSFENPLDGLVAERPCLALLEMTIRKMDYLSKDNLTVSMINKYDVERFKLALGHLDLNYSDIEQINDEWVEIIHDTIEQPLEESIEQMIQHKCRTKYERVKCFERYNDLLMKSLKEGLNALEDAEYTYLYNMLDIKEGENLLNLMREMYEMRGEKNA